MGDIADDFIDNFNPIGLREHECERCRVLNRRFCPASYVDENCEHENWITICSYDEKGDEIVDCHQCEGCGIGSDW